MDIKSKGRLPTFKGILLNSLALVFASSLSFYFMRIFLFVFLLLSYTSIFAQCPDGYVTSNTNLAKNGDFSGGNTSFTSDYIYSDKRSEGMNIWLDEGYYSVVNDPKYSHIHYASCRDHTSSGGNMMVINGSQSPDKAVWKQQVSVEPNTYYYFSTWIANAVPAAPSELVFSINGKRLGDPIIATMETCIWKQFFAVWFSGEAKMAEISIVNLNLIAGGNDFILDDIVFYTCEKNNMKRQVESAKVGEIIALRNIFFDNAKWDLKKESVEELEILNTYLSTHKKVEIEIDGHTDNVGNDDANLTLSENRAKAVFDYLIGKKISKTRMTFRGFGETKPIDSNETIEGRQKNRRVEFVIRKK